MTERIDPRQLAEWRALAKAATPGDWRVVKNRDGTVNVVCDYAEDGDRYSAKICLVNGRSENAAVFIAASRAAVPALIAEVRRLEAELDDVQSPDLIAQVAALTRERDAALARESKLREALEALCVQGGYLDLARAVLSAAEYWREPCDHFADVTKMVPADSPVPPAEPVLPLPTQDVYYSEVAGVVTEYARAIDAKAPDAALTSIAVSLKRLADAFDGSDGSQGIQNTLFFLEQKMREQ